MDNKKNDMFAVMMYQQDASLEDLALHGITPDNTGLQDRDYYKNKKSVQAAFTDENTGKLDEVKFNNFYDSVATMYNTFSTTDYQHKLVDSLPRDPFDWTQPLNGNIKDISAVITRSGGDPDFARRAKGMTGIGRIGDPVFSMREIAQDNNARDKDGKILDWTPNNRGLFKSIFDPTMVLATYDKDEYDSNGVFHRKGSYKVDEWGDPYYEELGNRDIYGKEVLHFTDCITVDGTSLNKWDFFDSDGLTKSAGKVAMQTIATIAPLLIPGVGEIWGYIGMTTGLIGAMPMLMKGVNSILGVNDTPYGKSISSAAAWMERWKPSQSDASKGKFMTFENFGEIIRSSAGQLFAQRQIARLSQKLLSGGEALVNSNIGRALSLGYMAITSSTDTYGAFKEAGASDAAAGIGMFATMAALYGLMRMDYFKDNLFKGQWLDESEAKNVTRNYVKDQMARLAEAQGVKEVELATEKEAATFFTNIKEGAEKMWKKFVKSPLSGTPKDITVPKGTTAAVTAGKKEVGKNLLSTFDIWLNRSVNEGVEETMEEVSQDLIKALFSGCEALGIDMTSDNAERLDFGWNFKEALERYLTSFGGGFVGGAVFEGIDQYERAFYKTPHISDFKNTSEQLLYLVLSGRGNEVKEYAKLYRDKGVLADKNLSIKPIKKSDGSVVFGASNGTDNQNEWAYQLVCHEVNRLTEIVHNAGITNGAIARWLMEFKGNIDKIGQLDTIASEAIKKLSLHTSYMDDLVELCQKIIDIESDIESAKPKPLTDEQKRNGEAVVESEEYKDLIKIRENLIKQRDDFFQHKNDKKYIEQALFLANAPLQRILLNIVDNDNVDTSIQGARQIDQNVFEQNSGFANYVQMRYHKNIYEMSEAARNWYKKEYDTFREDPENITDIQNVGKTLFELHQTVKAQLNDGLKVAETELKEALPNGTFVHRVHYGSKEYKRYVDAKSGLVMEQKNLDKLTHEMNSIEDTSSQEYIDAAAKVSESAGKIQEYQNTIEQYELLHDPIKDLFMESASTNGLAFQEELLDRWMEIRDLRDALLDPKNKDNIDEIQMSIASTTASLFSGIEQYFDSLKETGIIAGSETNFLLSGLFKMAAEVLENYPDDQWVAPDGSTILDSLDPDIIWSEHVTGTVLNDFKTSLIDVLKSGNVQDVHNVIKKLPDILKSLIYSYKGDAALSNEQLLEVATRVSDLLQKAVFGTNIEEFINKINETSKSIKTYSSINLLESMNIAVGSDVKSLLDLIDEQKKSLIAVSDLTDFTMEPNAKDALLKAKSLLNFAIAAIQTAADGTNEQLNLIPGGENDIEYAVISDSTKQRLLEDIQFLYDTVDSLLTIVANNENTKQEYPQKSEVHFHKMFMTDLMNGTSDNKATFVGKFAELGADLKDLWDQAGTETEVSTDTINLDRDTYANYKKRFIRFWQLVRDKVLEKHSVLEVGEALGEVLDSDARLNQYGEINSGEDLVNEEKNHLTNLGMTVVIGALLNDDYGEFYSDYVAQQNDESYPYTPLMQQEIAVLVSYEFAKSKNEESIFTGIIKGVNDSKLVLPEGTDEKVNKEAVKNALTMFENLFFIQGGTGAGKTTATMSLVFKMLKAYHEKIGKEFTFTIVAPENSQLQRLGKSLGLSEEEIKKHGLIQADFIKELVGDEDGPILYNADLETDDSGFTERVKKVFKCESGHLNTAVSDDFLSSVSASDKLKDSFVFIDEAQFYNRGCLQVLEQVGKLSGTKFLMCGDVNQNGATFKYKDTIATDNIKDTLTLSCPSLGESIRWENIAKESNYKSIKAALDEINSKWSKSLEYRAQEMADIANQVIESRLTHQIPVTFKYYESNDAFVGEKQIKSEDIDAYITKFKELSKKLHDDGSYSVCVIVESADDKNKYIGSDVTLLTAEEVFSSREVHGQEFDFVIIDKSFDTADLGHAYIDLYTLMGRSKVGTAIAADLSELKIQQDTNGSPSLTNKINTDDSFQTFGEWKKAVYNTCVGSTEEEPPKPTKGGEGENTDNEEVEATNALLGIGEKAIDTKDPKPVILPDSSDEGSKIYSERIDAYRKAHVEALKSDGKVSFAWNSFVEWALSETGLLHSEGVSPKTNKSSNQLSILSDFESIKGDDVTQRVVTFFRKFASAAVYNMKIQPHHIITLKNLLNFDVNGNDIVDELVNLWNSEIESGNHTFIAASDQNNNKSIIYWNATISGKTKLVPIAIIDGVVSGKTTVDGKTNIFQTVDPFWAIKGNPTTSKVSINTVNTGVGVVSQSKILAMPEKTETGSPGEGFNTTQEDTKRYIANNNGHAMALVSDCEILQKEDFDTIFKSKEKNDRVLYAFNVESASDERVPDDGKIESYEGDLIMTAKVNGTTIPVLSINTHKYVDLITLYDICMLGKFAAGELNYEALSKTQQQLINNTKNRKAAEEVLSKFLGVNVSFNDTTGSAVSDVNANVAANKRKLSFDYRLLSPKASYSFVGGVYSALYYEHPGLQKTIDAKIWSLLAAKPYTSNRSGITYRNTLVIQTKNDKGKLVHYKVLCDIMDKRSVFKIIKLKDDLSENKKTKPIVINPEDVTNFSIIDIFKKINNSETDDGVYTNLSSGTYQIQLQQELSYGTSADPELKAYNDYNVIPTIFKAISSKVGLPEGVETITISDLAKIVEKHSKIFKDGFTLNENRQMSDASEKSREATKWAESQTTDKTGIVKSNLESIQGGLWTLIELPNGDQLFKPDNTILVSFKYGASSDQDENTFTFDVTTDGKWTGNTINLVAKVDDAWLQTFTTWDGTHKGKYVTVKSIDFNTGKVILSVGTKTVETQLRKSDTGAYPTISDLSNNKILNNSGYKSNVGKFTIVDGKIFTDGVELRPIFRLDDKTYFASEDGSKQLAMDTSYAQTNNIADLNAASEVKNVGKNLYKDADGQFYTNSKKLGKVLEYSENFVTFNFGTIAYEDFPKSELPASKQNSNPEKPKRDFLDGPEFKLTQYLGLNGSELIAFGDGVVTNGAWMYNNSDYNGGDCIVVIRKVNLETRVVTCSDGKTYTLNDSAMANFTGTHLSITSAIKCLLSYRIPYAEKLSLLGDEFNFSDLHSAIEAVNERLEMTELVEISEWDVYAKPKDNVYRKVEEYANNNGYLSLPRLLEIKGNLYIFTATDRSGNTIGVYHNALNGKTVGSIADETIIAGAKSILEKMGPRSMDFKLLDSLNWLRSDPTSSRAVNKLQDWLENAPDTVDDSFYEEVDNFYQLAKSLNDALEPLRDNTQNCNF